MTLPLSVVMASRMEKAAADNGFDGDPVREGGWIAVASSRCPLRVWLGAVGETVFLVGLSQANVALALGDHGTPLTAPLPRGARGGRSVTTMTALYALLRRAFQLGRSLPNELLQRFEAQTRSLPRSTEVERMTVQRVGQDIFREGLLEYWEGRCAVTGLAVPEILRASHIKRWADCDLDAERLDIWNGLLLAPHLDAVFDQGFVTVADDGAVVVSPELGSEARHLLGLDAGLRVKRLEDGHRAYLAWHRAREFRSPSP